MGACPPEGPSTSFLVHRPSPFGFPIQRRENVLNAHGCSGCVVCVRVCAPSPACLSTCVPTDCRSFGDRVRCQIAHALWGMAKTLRYLCGLVVYEMRIPSAEECVQWIPNTLSVDHVPPRTHCWQNG